MKILCPRAYYDPEQTAGSHLMQDLEEQFITRHTIEYLVSTPTRGISKEVHNKYKHRLREEKNNGRILIRRFPMFREGKSPLLRAFRYLLCNIAQIYYGSCEKDVDVIYSGSTPPTIGVTCIQISKKIGKKQNRKIPVIYKLDDVFPDSLVQAGLTHKGSMIWNIGRAIENYIYNNVDTLIVNCDGMRKNLIDKGVPETKLRVVSNWIDFSAVNPISKESNHLFEELKIPRDKYTVLYAGNFGEAQGAEIILEAAIQTLNEKKINYVVFGGGTHFNEFKERASRMPNIQVFSLLPLDRVSEVYSLADVALITCKPGFGGIGMPSKTWSIMACNKRIIASYDVESDLSSIIKKIRAGVTVEPGNSVALSNAIIKSFNEFENGVGLDKHIREETIQIASKDLCTKEFLKIIEEAVK